MLRSKSKSNLISVPYERWFIKPNVSNLELFGCKALVHVPDSKRNCKLDKKSTTWVFVGYPKNDNGLTLFRMGSTVPLFRMGIELAN